MRRVGLVGRDEELARLVRHLTGSHARVVAITGPLGVGKSALLAAGVAAVTGDGIGVWTADLSVATPGSPLLDEVARALGVWPARASAGSSLDVLAGMIAGGRVVIAVDHADAAAFDTGIGELVARCPRLTIVVASSRPPTAVFDARVPLGPLPVPAMGATGDEIRACPSVRLFIGIAERVTARPVLGAGPPAGDPPAAGEIDAVAEICRLLGGMPFAIELAAARTRLLPPARLARELGADSAGTDGLDLLSSDAPDGGGGVREALAAARALLTREQDELFLLLAPLRGPFPLEAARALGGRSLGDLLDELGALVDLRLIEPYPDHRAEPVFRMLPIVRAFALHERRGGRLEDADLSSYVRGLAHAAAEDIALAASSEDAERLRIMRADVVAVLRALADAAPADAAALAVDIAPVWEGYAEGAAVGEVLDAVIRSDVMVELPENVQAGAWLWASRMLALSPDGAQHSELVRERWLRGMELVDAERWPQLALQARMVAVLNAPTTGDFRLSVQAAVEGQELARALAQPAWEGRFEVWSSAASHHTGDIERSVALAASALDRGARVGDPTAVLGAVMMLHTLPEGAVPADMPVPSLEDGLALARETDDTMMQSFLLAAMTRRELSAGRLPAAAHWCAQRLDFGRRRGWTVLAPISFVHAGLIAAASGDAAFATRLAGVVRVDIERVMRSMAPATRPAYESTLDGLRSALGAERFAQLLAQGGTLSTSDATSEAIDWLLAHSPRDSDAPGERRAPTGAQPITARERDVLEHLAAGMTNKEIALRLGLSVKTVMHHSVSIYRKLGVRGRAEATAYAYRNGLLPLVPLQPGAAVAG